MAVVDIYNTTNKYSIIYTDPPWQQTKGGAKKVRPNSSGKPLDYQVMSMGYIKALHGLILPTITEKKHNVFMWTIDKYLHETEWMMEELGYRLHARIIWDKCNGPNPAYTLRFSNEYLLWFYQKGNILMPCDNMRGKYTTVIREQSQRPHSKKPIAAYEMFENMFPRTKKLEMFARNKREGWDCWGNEV